VPGSAVKSLEKEEMHESAKPGGDAGRLRLQTLEAMGWGARRHRGGSAITKNRIQEAQNRQPAEGKETRSKTIERDVGWETARGTTVPHWDRGERQ